MGHGAFIAAVARAIAIAICLSAVALAAPTPAVAQSTSQYRVELNQLELDMHALRGEIERFQVKAYYCNPPYGPLKQPDEMQMAALSARADALNTRYQEIRNSLIAFIGSNNRLAAELELNGSTPTDPKWWRRYDSARDRMMAERNRKRDALARAPVRNCAPRVTPAPTQVAPAQVPSFPQPPSYPEIVFPTVPTHFCSQEEYWRFINDIINPQYLKAAENAEAAARFRAQVEAAINGYVQAGRAIPAELQALRRRAQSEFAAQQRLSDEIARLRDRARRTPVIDCSKEQGTEHGSVTVPPSRYGPLLANSMHSQVYRAYLAFTDARERCDRAAMARALAELERLAREAHDQYEGVALSMHGGPFDQADTPENNAYWAAEADAKEAERLRDRARRQQANCPCNQIQAVPPAQALQNAERSVARWIQDTDRLFDQLAAATQAKDCARIQAIFEQISRRLGTGKPIIWASVTPPQYLVKWRLLYLRARETCRPPRERPESILDEIDEVPVISQVPTDRTSAALLAYHNQLRAQVGSVPLRWNPTLAAHAAEYARMVADTGQLQHSSREGRQKTERENIGVGRAGSPMAMVQMWGKEARYFRPGTFPNVCSGDWSQCAHYTQMIWSTTTDVGCAYASGRFDALVCRYSPPGNRDGRPVTGVPPIQSATQPCPPTALTVMPRQPN